MSKQDNGVSGYGVSGVITGFRPGRRAAAGIAVIVMLTTLYFTSNVFAHNIDLDKAWEETRNYARSVRKESNGKFKHYSTNCVLAFPKHNHIVRCVIDYQNAKDRAAGVYTCRETIEVYLFAHNVGGENYSIRGRHTSHNTCGSRRLDGQMVP